MKKTFAGMMVCIICIVSFSFMNSDSVYAKDNEDLILPNNHLEFLTLFFSNTYNVYLTNGNAEDVTIFLLPKMQSLFEENKIDDVNKIIQNEDLVLHIVLDSEKQYNGNLFAYDRFKTVESEILDFYLRDQYDGTTLYVQTLLSGGIWYNENTNEVTNVSEAKLTITGWDTTVVGMEIAANDISTGSNVVGGKGYFWGQCSFVGLRSGQGIEDLYYGSKRVSFYAVP